MRLRSLLLCALAPLMLAFVVAPDTVVVEEVTFLGELPRPLTDQQVEERWLATLPTTDEVDRHAEAVQAQLAAQEAARLAAEEEARRAAEAAERAAEEAERAEREQEAAARPSSTVGATVWDDIARCESGYGGEPNWSINTGNGFSGGLQWHPDTWMDVKPTGAPDQAHLATREQEIQAAETLMSRPWGGLHHWPACTRKLGLR